LRIEGHLQVLQKREPIPITGPVPAFFFSNHFSNAFMTDLSKVIDILYEEGPCLAVAKPTGLLTQAPPGIDSMEARIKAFLKERKQKPGGVYLAVPHRLDRPVSGAMVFAKHVRAARRLSEQFEARSVRKVYWACVAGEVSPESGTWTDFVRKIPDRPLAEIIPAEQAKEFPDVRPAVLHYRVRGQAAWGTWLEIELETGRMHQIRLQAASRGHAVLGDLLYGSGIPFGEQHADERLRSIALHARSLAFHHPMTHEPVQVFAPLPVNWQSLNCEFVD
jgi:23S rRNA pseudouridine1911/1915/1917 synthase